ncbi:hypothetical protein GGI26_005484 [Coemansia sp. RSA 1358]|nr:hypothetical protein GGI26_005484 [Coemansia sp. RSA 1358]
MSQQPQPQSQPQSHQAPSTGQRQVVRGGVAQINVANLERHINKEVQTYSDGGFPRQSERYYRLMSVLHITRMLYHDGHCQPIHREFYRRLAQIHHQQQQTQQQPIQQQQPQQQAQPSN